MKPAVESEAKSKNKGGRPPNKPATIVYNSVGWDVRDLARSYTVPAIETLAEIMQDETANAPSRIVAAQTILDRGWGKAVQTVEANVNIVDKLNYDELRAHIAGQLEKIVTLDSAEYAEGDGAGDRAADLVGVEESVRGEPR